MNRLFLYYFFISAFLALVLVVGYLLLLAGGKYNGEDLSPAAIYDRARNSSTEPVVEPRKVDPNLQPPTELERINEENFQYQQMLLMSPSPGPNYGSPYFNPYSGGQ